MLSFAMESKLRILVYILEAIETPVHSFDIITGSA